MEVEALVGAFQALEVGEHQHLEIAQHVGAVGQRHEHGAPAAAVASSPRRLERRLRHQRLGELVPVVAAADDHRPGGLPRRVRRLRGVQRVLSGLQLGAPAWLLVPACLKLLCSGASTPHCPRPPLQEPRNRLVRVAQHM